MANLNEIRLTKHLIEAAREIMKDDPELLDSLAGFERAIWSDNFDLIQYKVTYKQMKQCIAAAYVELRRGR
jgi:hypothetical protein